MAAMPERTSRDEIRQILESSRAIAVLGAHAERARPAFYVPQYLHEQGYRCIGVNPHLVGQTLWGEPVRASLAEIGEPIDVVDVFRRASHLPDHLDDILAMDPHPKTVWLQLGVRNDSVAKALVDAGIDVVQDRCMLADHKRML